MRQTVLLVDDEPDVKLLVEEHLRLEGVDVFCAAVGAIDEGLVRTAELQPDLVVLDHRFDGDVRTGAETAGQFKEAGAGMVLVFTVESELADEVETEADAVLDKMRFGLLPATVQLLLGA